jgi:hypothetical protein
MGRPLQGNIQQTIPRLVVGDTYDVHFFVASAQNWGRFGDVMTQFRVSLCGPGDTLGPSGNTAAGGFPHSGAIGCSQYSPIVDSGNHGFAGWDPVSLMFKADSTTETLSFLAIGVPESQPPIALLDGVTMTPVPEPSTWALVGIGFALIIGFAYYRRPKWVSVA